MAIATEASITRARRALDVLAGRPPAGDGEICLACGKPVDGDSALRHHGDVFHPGCALYRGRHST